MPAWRVLDSAFEGGIGILWGVQPAVVGAGLESNRRHGDFELQIGAAALLRLLWLTYSLKASLSRRWGLAGWWQ